MTKELIKKVVIGDFTYNISRFGVNDGLTLALKVNSLIYPIILSLSGSVKIDPQVLKKLKEKSESENNSELSETDKKEAMDELLNVNSSLDMSVLSGAFKEALKKPDEVAGLIKDLLQVVSIQNKDPKGRSINVNDVFESHFIGKYGSIMNLAWEVIEFNGFLDLIGDGFLNKMI